MERIEEMWGHLKLTKDEDEPIELEEEAREEVHRKCEWCLIGKFYMERSIGRAIVESTMVKIWRVGKQATVKEVGPNVFIITFSTQMDKKRIEEGRPWSFDNNLFVIKPFDGYVQPNMMKFDNALLWVQMHNLLLVGMNCECGERIGRSLGVVEEVEVDEDDVGWGTFLRVKVLLDLTKPIARRRKVTINGSKFWIPLKYEKLPRFYFKCGRILHEGNNWQQSGQQEGEAARFGL
ncbi:uncharacterized protein LOC121255023 [Juglans microcarpa x Juglans regia]|uniref:uncharacterized protein LOC121255023 n=1 Tax=Juglans microcarpa x Juglans regia TaxID=2249226 RepID=UPI001B7EC144|nr:uncharacterized protein LOC121255023 [Juglans microcarpa x Juglans regia]